MTWTSPDSKSDGDLIDQTIWNNQVRNNLLHLLNAVEPLSLTNKSGSAVTEGMVVIHDSGNDNAFTTTTTAGKTNVLGVVADPAGIANDASGRIAGYGIKTVAVQGNVSRGDYLETSTTAGRAKSAGTTRTQSTFAIALTAYGGGGAGTVTAWVMVSTVSGAVPINSIMYTTDASPPSAFTEYTAAQGRTIVGVPSGGTIGGTVGTALTNLQNPTHTHTLSTTPSHTHDINADNGGGAGNARLAGSNGGGTNYTATTLSAGSASPSTSAANHITPYIQLLVIQKS